MFNPAAYTAPKAKPLPVILLLDVSGSMGGAKIQSLNDAVRDMLESFRDNETGETEIHVAIITFGREVKLHQPLASAGDIRWNDLAASGGTPLGTALRMAKAMIEDKNEVPSRAYRPTIVLISDGQPTDKWEEPLRDFVGSGRSSKCERMAMAIGANADAKVLGRFIEGSSNTLFFAENAKQLRDFFKFVTMSVTVRMRSQDPNCTPKADVIDVKPATIEARTERPGTQSAPPQSPDADSDETPDEEGYW